MKAPLCGERIGVLVQSHDYRTRVLWLIPGICITRKSSALRPLVNFYRMVLTRGERVPHGIFATQTRVNDVACGSK